MQLKTLLTSKTIWRGVVLSALAALLAFKYVVRRPSAEAAATAPPAPATVLLGAETVALVNAFHAHNSSACSEIELHA